MEALNAAEDRTAGATEEDGFLGSFDDHVEPLV